ncbi:MAG: hypothetical protein M1142_03175, partial [Patescibacteria group bacterium]|nr:hypothetical protein [Patescibacteria group bacterium]
MKVFHLPKRLPPGFIFLVIFLIALPGFMLGKNQVSLAKMLPSLLSEKVFPVSRAEILTEGQRVSVKFQITSKDEGKVKEFSQNLGVDNRWTQGLSVSLDGDTGKFLVNFLPAQVNLTIKPKEIDFASNENVGFFDPSLMTEIYHGSFGDGTISVQDINGQGYQIDIDNPAPVVSGQTQFYN